MSFEINETRRRDFASKILREYREVKVSRLKCVYDDRGRPFTKTRFSVAFCQPARARALLQVEIVTDTENPSALILGAFIPSRATRSHVHSFHLIFFHNFLPRVYRRNEKVMSEPPFEAYLLIAFDTGDRDRGISASKLSTLNWDRDRYNYSRKKPDFFTKILLAIPRQGRNFSAPAPRRMALVYCLQLNNIT